MGQSFLFEMEPYTVHPRRRRRSRRPPMPQNIRYALARLRQTLDAIPQDEMEERERRWESMKRAFRQI